MNLSQIKYFYYEDVIDWFSDSRIVTHPLLSQNLGFVSTYIYIYSLLSNRPKRLMYSLSLNLLMAHCRHHKRDHNG